MTILPPLRWLMLTGLCLSALSCGPRPAEVLRVLGPTPEATDGPPQSAEEANGEVPALRPIKPLRPLVPPEMIPPPPPEDPQPFE